MARACFAVLMIIGLDAMLRVAWVCDDSLITVRTIFNALHGYGPNFNIDERVQAYTHPLWFLCSLLATALLGSPWLAILLLSFGCVSATLWIIYARIGGGRWSGIVAVAALLLSKAFLDYTSSGLETPLSSLLIVGTVAAGFRQCRADSQGGMTACLVCAGLLYLTRADLALLLAPFVAFVIWQTTARSRAGLRSLAVSFALAAVPVILWTGFSLVYYGSLVPNTAYAKLGGSVPQGERALQGWLYLANSAGLDTVTLPFIAFGIFQGFRQSKVTAALALGIGVYLLYIVRVGGDQMSGRFLVPPLIVAATILAHATLPPLRFGVQAAALMLLGMLNLPVTLMSDPKMPAQPLSDANIFDERASFFHVMGVVRVTRQWVQRLPWEARLHATRQVNIIECGGLGIFGLVDGPAVHVADRCGLADPLFARLSATPTSDWRISHLIRPVPAGYRESLERNANLISDPRIARLYGDIRLTTRGPLFTAARWGAILRLNQNLLWPH